MRRSTLAQVAGCVVARDRRPVDTGLTRSGRLAPGDFPRSGRHEKVLADGGQYGAF